MARVRTSCEFWVPGQPAKKGSTRSFAHARTCKIVTLAADPKLVAWESAVAVAASNAWASITAKPVMVRCMFRLKRPKSHYGTGRNEGIVKATAPKYPASGNKNDVDKMLRAVLDGLTDVVFADDCQVVDADAKKRWAGERGPGALIEVFELEG
jgi:Holliday junction resolvase RusA-like endonuclease